MLRSALGVATLAMLASAFAPSLGILIACRLISGMGVGMSTPPLFSLAVELAPAGRKGQAVALVASFWMVGAIAVALLAPIAAMLVQMAISRAREYEADRVGAGIGGDPAALARALEKIEAYARGGYVNYEAERNPATAHMFIINPLNGKGADSLFSTHPATHNRVEALMRLGVGQGTTARRPTPVTTSAGAGPWG